jgi:energy-coupling factor transport system permease protein
VTRFDPRTKLLVGVLAMAAVLLAPQLIPLAIEGGLLLLCLPLLRLTKAWLRYSLKLIWPMVAMVFVISWFFLDHQMALLLALRLIDLLTVSFILFQLISPEQMAEALKKLGVPYSFAFILTTAMRYVPLIGQRIRHIRDAQLSRGIDLRPRLRNAANFMALLMPLLVQSFVLSEELAVAMETRGFACKGRTSRRHYRLTWRDYSLMLAALLLFAAFVWWQRG